MDLRATPAEAALRDEVRDWLRANLPWEYGKGLPPRFDDLSDEVAFGRTWQAKLASGVVTVVGSLPIAFADYSIAPPQSMMVLSVADNGTMELQLHFTKG